MKKTFIHPNYHDLTVILQCDDPEVAIRRIKNSLKMGADAFGLQVESLPNHFQTESCIRRIFEAMEDKPIYATYYRKKHNDGKTDEEIGEGILRLAKYGATLCDVMGDLYEKNDNELSEGEDAIRRQMDLIERIKDVGSEVLISSHLYRYAPAEVVLSIAREQFRRGADVAKVVTKAENMEQQIENMNTSLRLKESLNKPFLFLAGGESSIHRRLGEQLGNCMTLCVYEHDEQSTKAQPYLEEMLAIRKTIRF